MEPVLENQQKDLEELLEEELQKKRDAEKFLLGSIEKHKAEVRTAEGSKKESVNLLDTKPGELHEKLQKMADAFKASRAALDKAFQLEGTPEVIAEVKRTLADLDLTKHSFSAIALASVASDSHDGELKFLKITEKTHKGLAPGNDMLDTCKKACSVTKDAIAAYKNGDPGPLGKIMGAGVRNACHQFATTLDRKEAIKWSNYIEDVLPALEKDPELQKASGLSMEEMHAANGAVQIGCIFKRGFKALDEIFEASTKSVPISETRMVELTAYMTQMEFAAFQRETEVADWLKKSEESRGQYLNSTVQQQYGEKGLPVKDVRVGIIPQAQLDVIQEISKSKAMEKLMDAEPRESIRAIMNVSTRKSFMENVYIEISDKVKKNKEPASTKEKTAEKKQEPIQKNVLKKDDVLVPSGPVLKK